MLSKKKKLFFQVDLSQVVDQIICDLRKISLVLSFRFCAYISYLEAGRETSQKSHTNAKSNQGGHGAVRNGGCELNQDRVVLVRDLDMIPLGDVELLQRKRMFRVRDGAN